MQAVRITDTLLSRPERHIQRATDRTGPYYSVPPGAAGPYYSLPLPVAEPKELSLPPAPAPPA